MATVLVLLLVILALGVLIILLITVNRWRSPDQAEPHAGAAQRAAWLQGARDAAEQGQRVVNHLDHLEIQSTPDELDDTTLDEAIQRLDLLSSRVSQASSTAPTAMDARVCRSVAVSAKTLADELRREGNERRRLEALDNTTDNYPRRRIEFDLAVRDLRNHVDLL